MKFKYKFDSIKKVKEILEKRVQKEVAEIQLAIEKKEEEYDAVFQRRLEESSRKLKAAPASELKFQKMYIASLGEQLEKIRNEINDLEKDKQKKLDELVQKSKEHKIFNTLEDLFHEDFDKEQNKLELSSIDELATQKYVRNKN